jgi:hypothetical protein
MTVTAYLPRRRSVSLCSSATRLIRSARSSSVPGKPRGRSGRFSCDGAAFGLAWTLGFAALITLIVAHHPPVSSACSSASAATSDSSGERCDCQTIAVGSQDQEESRIRVRPSRPSGIGPGCPPRRRSGSLPDRSSGSLHTYQPHRPGRPGCLLARDRAERQFVAARAPAAGAIQRRPPAPPR